MCVCACVQVCACECRHVRVCALCVYVCVRLCGWLYNHICAENEKFLYRYFTCNITEANKLLLTAIYRNSVTDVCKRFGLAVLKKRAKN